MTVLNVFHEGRSMGARAAVMVSNDVQTNPKSVLGVVCLSYPLHPPKDQSNRRDEPLYELQKPVLFVSGTKDSMCDKDIFEEVYSKLNNACVTWIEGGDHGLSNKGKVASNWQDRINTAVSQWCHHLMDDGNVNKLHETFKEKESRHEKSNPGKTLVNKTVCEETKADIDYKKTRKRSYKVTFKSTLKKSKI